MERYRTNMWHLKKRRRTSWSRTQQNQPNGGYCSKSLMWQRLDDISVSANSLLSVLLLCLSSLKCFLFPPVHEDGWESRDLQQRRNITSVQKQAEESIKVPCEKFPESIRRGVPDSFMWMSESLPPQAHARMCMCLWCTHADVDVWSRTLSTCPTNQT